MTSPFKEALREELRAAAYRDLRRHTIRKRVAAALGAVGLAIAGSLALLWPSPAAADVEVRVRNGNVEVRITDLRTDPSEVKEAMESKGLTVDVEPFATGPSAVGRFVVVALTDGDTSRITKSGSDGYSFDAFVVPVDYPGRLLIGVGVAAEPGEPYASGTNALAPREPLACQALIGQLVRDVSAPGRVDLKLSPKGVATSPIAIEDPAAAPYSDWFVAEALTLSDSSVILVLSQQPVPQTSPPC